MGKAWLVLGTGITGRSVIEFCKRHKIEFFVFDENEIALRNLAEDSSKKIFNLKDCDFSKLEKIVVSPAFFNEKNHHRIFKLAGENNVKIISDLEIFFKNVKAKTIGITGTNGKSTVVSLISHVLNKCGRKAIACGNIGIPFLDVVEKDYDFFVCEISSYQLSLIDETHFDYAAITNITPDHLDKYHDFESYFRSKFKILNGTKQEFFKIGEPVYLNTHIENIEVSYNICRQIGLRHDEIISAMSSFQSLEHRTEFVRSISNVTFINDSKATNMASTKNALGLFGDIYLILGGLKKEEPFLAAKYFNSVKKVYLIGSSTEDFSAELNKIGIEFDPCGDIATAVQKAYTDAKQTGGTVLLSPACASFDQFRSYEERGSKFKEIVNCV